MRLSDGKNTDYNVAVLEQAEQYNVDVVLGMRPFHHISTTTHFRLLAERLGSPRLKFQLSPGDSLLSAECDVATAGFTHVRPYLHGLHIKDVHVIDGPKGRYEWRPFGEGNVDYRTLMGNLFEHHSLRSPPTSAHPADPM